MDSSKYCFTPNRYADISPSVCPVGPTGFHGQTVSFSVDLPDSARLAQGSDENLDSTEGTPRRIWANYAIQVDSFQQLSKFRLINFGAIPQAPTPPHAQLAFQVEMPENASGLILLGIQGYCPDTSSTDAICWNFARGLNPRQQAHMHNEFALCLFNGSADSTVYVYDAVSACGDNIEVQLPPLSVNIDGDDAVVQGGVGHWTARAPEDLLGVTWHWMMAPAFEGAEQSYSFASEVGQGFSLTHTVDGSSYLYLQARDTLGQVVLSGSRFVLGYVYIGGGSSPTMSISGPTSVQPGSSCTWRAGLNNFTEPHSIVWHVSTGGGFLEAGEGSTFSYSAWSGSLTIRATARRTDGSSVASADRVVTVTSSAPEC